MGGLRLGRGRLDGFATDPETPGIMQEAGHLGRPSLGQYLGSFNA